MNNEKLKLPPTATLTSMGKWEK
jgi:hypothetical protein